MLEYFKVILEKVSFDGKLFEKELKKAINAIMSNEVMELKRWCTLRFGAKYLAVIENCFRKHQEFMVC
nr:hypothetical protein [Flexithrix dorotheae]